MNKSTKKLNIDAEKSMDLISMVKNSLSSFNIKSNIKYFYIAEEKDRREFSRDNCGAGRTMWTMNQTGELRPCCIFSEEYLTCGNLAEEKFEDVFKSKNHKKLAELIFPCEEYCKGCEYLPYCKDCLCNGIVMYEKIGDRCKWGDRQDLKSWINIKKLKIRDQGGE